MRAATFLQRPVHRLEQIERPIQSLSARSGGKQVAVADKKQCEAAAFELEKTAEGFASAAADTVTSLGALALHTEAMVRLLPDAAGLHSFA